jgi:hypothetical protein
MSAPRSTANASRGVYYIEIGIQTVRREGVGRPTNLPLWIGREIMFLSSFLCLCARFSISMYLRRARARRDQAERERQSIVGRQRRRALTRNCEEQQQHHAVQTGLNMGRWLQLISGLYQNSSTMRSSRQLCGVLCISEIISHILHLISLSWCIASAQEDLFTFPLAARALSPVMCWWAAG